MEAVCRNIALGWDTIGSPSGFDPAPANSKFLAWIEQSDGREFLAAFVAAATVSRRKPATHRCVSPDEARRLVEVRQPVRRPSPSDRELVPRVVDIAGFRLDQTSRPESRTRRDITAESATRGTSRCLGRRQPSRRQRQHIVLNGQPTLRRRVSAGGPEVGHLPVTGLGFCEVAQSRLHADPATLVIHDDIQQPPTEHLRCLLAWTLPSDRWVINAQLRRWLHFHRAYLATHPAFSASYFRPSVARLLNACLVCQGNVLLQKVHSGPEDTTRQRSVAGSKGFEDRLGSLDWNNDVTRSDPYVVLRGLATIYDRYSYWEGSREAAICAERSFTAHHAVGVTGCQEFLKEKDSTLAFCQMPSFQMPLAKRPVPLENR